MKWEIIRHRIIGTCYVATIKGGDDLPLRAYISYNGANWFNWCISPHLDDFMMEHSFRLDGGARTLKQAKADVQKALVGYILTLAAAMGFRLIPETTTPAADGEILLTVSDALKDPRVRAGTHLVEYTDDDSAISIRLAVLREEREDKTYHHVSSTYKYPTSQTWSKTWRPVALNLDELDSPARIIPATS